MTTNNTTNPYHQFLRMVWQLRRAQKDYFKYKSNSALENSKRLERDVDKWLESVGFEAQKIKQMTMDDVATKTDETAGLYETDKNEE